MNHDEQSERLIRMPDRLSDRSVGLRLSLFQWIVGFFFIELVWTFIGGGVTFVVMEATRNTAWSSSSWIIYLIQHVNFLVLAGVLLLFIHKAVRTTLLRFVTDFPRFRWRLFFFGFSVWIMAVGVATAVTALFEPQAIMANRTGNLWDRMLLMTLALVFTPLQCIAEEVLFRTTIWRMLGSRVRRPWTMGIVSGTIFLVAHLTNLEVQSSNFNLLILTYYFLSGFLFMEMTHHLGGTEAPFGAHIANNLFLVLLVNYAGSSLPGDPWFLQQEPVIWVDLGVLLLCSATIIRFGRRYQ